MSTSFTRFVRCAVPLAVTGRGLCSASEAASASPHQVKNYDLIVIGGGSGGLACAKRAAGYGAKVAIVESQQYGGTCVNVGCVPKKIMYNTAHVAETIEEAGQFGFTVDKPTFDWGKSKASRDTYIARLNRIYEAGLDGAGVTRIAGRASFEACGEASNPSCFGSVPVSVNVDTPSGRRQTVSAKHVVVAVGGRPRPLGVPGEEHCIDSNGFFALTEQPKRVAVLGAGYIAVELAGVFHGLGSETALFVRGHRALRDFDDTIGEHLHESMKKSGLNVHTQHTVAEVRKNPDGTLMVHFKNGQVRGPFDTVVSAIGRVPATDGLELGRAGVTTTPSGHIKVDAYQNTATTGVYALGDVCGKVELTPMAVAAGRRLADRLFNGMPAARADYNMVPTVVFSHPTIGTVGLTEAQARKQYPDPSDELRIYHSSFVNLHYGPFHEGQAGPKPMSKVKVICAGPQQRVVGLHMIGMGADEVLQGFAVALKMGATKADLDAVVAIHPTAAEELVTLPPWGLAPASDKVGK